MNKNNDTLNISRHTLTLKHEISTSNGKYVMVDDPVIVTYETLCYDPYKNFSIPLFNHIFAQLTDELRRYYLKENRYE